MCFAVPGKLISIEEGKYIIDYGVEKREAVASAIDVKLGDNVLISNKVIIKKYSKKEMKEFIELAK